MNANSDQIGSIPDAPLVIAHRGASHAYPENTIKAFVGAALLGADWVELDARRCADGCVVVHHDALLSDGRAIIDTAFADLPNSVPTLVAALEVCVAHDLGVNIEIKSDLREPDYDPEHLIVSDVIALIAERTGNYLVTSFDPVCLDRVRTRASALATGQLGFAEPDPETFVAVAAAAGHRAVNPWAPMVDQRLVTSAHRAGLVVYPWTVDDPDQMRSLLDLGVDGIITNEPAIARSVIDP